VRIKFPISAKRDDAIGNLMSSVGLLMVLMVATLVLSFGSFRMAILIGVVAVLSLGLSLGAGPLWVSVWFFRHRRHDGARRCGDQRFDRGASGAA